MVIKKVTLIFLFFFAIGLFYNGLLSQSLLAINKLLIPAIEEGWMEVSDAELIRVHLEKYGWPVVPEEVWAIPGLRPECSEILLKSTKWRTWCEWGKEEASGETYRTQLSQVNSSIVGQFDLNEEEYVGPNVGCVARFKGGNWGLVAERDVGEVGIDFVGGYIQGVGHQGVTWILGDHRVHWGSGAIINRYDPFQSMRSPHRLGQVSRGFDGVYSGDGSPFRRGVAVRKNMGLWWFASSLDSQKREFTQNSMFEFTWFDTGLHRDENELHRSVIRVNRFGLSAFRVNKLYQIGFVGEIGQTLGSTLSGLFGAVFRMEKNAFSFETEVGIFKGDFTMHNRAVLTASKHFFLFYSVDKTSALHPGRDWGVKAGAVNQWQGILGFSLGPDNKRFIVKSEMDQEGASVRSTMSWNHPIVNAGKVFSRLSVDCNIAGEFSLGARLRWDLDLFRLTAEFHKSGDSAPGFGRAFRVDLKSRRSMTFAVMNGVDGMEGRLFQLLPTARGYRLFSVGDSASRVIFSFDIIPDRLVFSIEKVWSVWENTTSTHRISIRLEGK
ncbi:MAG: hypothetical protein P8L64_08215 [Flavobacteriales bacterium]|nr:hypothetical protein [Flavobacteriales bacterium]